MSCRGEANARARISQSRGDLSRAAKAWARNPNTKNAEWAGRVKEELAEQKAVLASHLASCDECIGVPS